MIVGIGTDIVTVSRMAEKLTRGNGFKEKVFAPVEVAYCEAKANPAQHYAARFAAKEAFAKAMGTGWHGQCEITDLVIVNNQANKPEFRFEPAVQQLVNQLGIVRCHLSMSHTSEYATANVILETE